jgi:hypothetical protein
LLLVVGHQEDCGVVVAVVASESHQRREGAIKRRVLGSDERRGVSDSITQPSMPRI